MGEKRKILAVRTHCIGTDGKTRLSAVDWWRVHNPLTHLAKNTDWEVEFVTKSVNGKDVEYEGDKVGKDNVIISTLFCLTGSEATLKVIGVVVP